MTEPASQIAPENLETRGWRKRELPGYIGVAGPLWTRKEEAGWTYGVLATEAHLNPAGVVHGGVVATLMDHALSTVAWEALGRVPCLTVQLDIQYLDAARAGQMIEVRGQVTRKTSSLVFLRGEASVDGELVAAATAILKSVKSTRLEGSAPT